MKKTLVILLTLVLSAPVVSAQEEKPVQKDYTRGWYVGAQSGMPMAEADFSSFGADKFRPGWTAGVHAGYRFTPVWSLELSASWGQTFLAAQSCCYERNYFLGADHNRYRYTIPEGLGGWYYNDLKSHTFVQRYGLQVNMNVLGLFHSIRDSRWRLEVSPAVYAVGTSSDLMTKADNTPVADNINKWHLGYGGLAQVSYAVADNMNIGVYGGFTHLTGKPLDGMPALHSTNFIIDAGVKFSFAFGGKKRVCKSAPAVVPAVVSPTVSTEQPKPVVEEIVIAPVEKTESVKEVITSDTVAVQPIQPEVVKEQPNEVVEGVATTPVVTSTREFPVIYFSFNSVWIEPNERGKVKKMAEMMKADKSFRIRITGWCDEVGGEEVNKRVSLQRAEAVKRVLGLWLVPAERIETVGGGIKRDAASDAEARNATTIEIM
jgi:outer membrane protein OmpA-like peptidoglycan-associated protein/opacity protein-like surface antigen